MSSRRRNGGRDGWLGRLAELVAEEGDNKAAAMMWDELCEQLIADGVDPRRASEIALRCVRLAGRLYAGEEQREAARALGVSERTGKLDARRLRRLVESGLLSAPHFDLIPRTPRRHGDHVVMPGSVRTGRRPT